MIFILWAKIQLQKLQSRVDDLSAACNRCQTAFSAHKAVNFFCLNSEFVSNFAEGLQQVKSGVEQLAEVINAAVGPPDGVKQDGIIKNSDEQALHESECLEDSDADIVNISGDAIKKCSTVESLTPPPSESGQDGSVCGDGIPKSRYRRASKRGTSLPDSDSAKKKKFKRCLVESFPDTKAAAASSEAECEYEVQRIIDYKKQPGAAKGLYLVSWKNYGPDDDTWEPLGNLCGCEDLLIDFFCRRLIEREAVTDPAMVHGLALPSEEEAQSILKKAFIQFSSKQCRKPNDLILPIQMISDTKSFKMKLDSEIFSDITMLINIKDFLSEKYKKLMKTVMDTLKIREIYPKREKQLAELREWERNINLICQDEARIAIENVADLELPPKNFFYINEYLPTVGIEIPSDPVVGCECVECSINEKSCCPRQMNSHFAYNKLGKVRVTLGTPIYECNKRCSCSESCPNRIVQKGRRVELCIFRTDNGRGWGVKAMENIRKDTFVIEYVGEVISSEVAEQRGQVYDKEGCTYLFDLDYNKGDQNPYTVDAAKYGNASHFINHSCDPNLVVYNVWINCLDPDLPKLALFSARDIKKGEEITFDYNSTTAKQVSSGELLKTGDMSEVGGCITPDKFSPMKKFSWTPKGRTLLNGKTECRCGAPNCRKFFF